MLPKNFNRAQAKALNCEIQRNWVKLSFTITQYHTKLSPQTVIKQKTFKVHLTSAATPSICANHLNDTQPNGTICDTENKGTQNIDTPITALWITTLRYGLARNTK
jgi:hypothetical protein